MTKDEALRLALEALDDLARYADTCELFLKETHPGKAGSLRQRVTKSIEAITAIKAALEAKDEPWTPVSIGVDVTQEGTHVMALRLRPNGVNEVIYSQFHPLAQPEQPKVRTGNCLRVGVCASEGHKIQPQRTWVGLTNDEINEFAAGCHLGNSVEGAIYKAAAKLKEKNT